MIRKSYVLLALVLCFAFLLAGCPKKTVMKEEPGMKKSDEAAKRDAAEREKKEMNLRRNISQIFSIRTASYRWETADHITSLSML